MQKVGILKLVDLGPIRKHLSLIFMQVCPILLVYVGQGHTEEEKGKIYKNLLKQ